jgi:phosphoribosylanthranilate isomerase
MFVKYCGFTRAQDITAAASMGIWAAGFVFDSRSPRFVGTARARMLSDAIAGSGLATVGVFVESTPQQIVETCERANISHIQIYDDETQCCLQGFRPIIRAYRVRGADDVKNIAPPDRGDMILLDAFSSRAHGGTGRSFDWEMLAGFPYLDSTFVAGGISADTLPRLLAVAVPRGIDVSSGIEDAPGIKSHMKMASLITLVQEAYHDRTHHA